MMDYEEQQASELDILASIYCDDLQSKQFIFNTAFVIIIRMCMYNYL